ncbi:hypothetical protein N7493_005335 [Penicillium malachiteum]|uniref:Uncharacterized protein n=1 Tax=Penicillium malachiteum TaxID=1324776 RepID=A0AAD6MWF2_9EURO|nr:hypothetical protein N7493_005335 [Penicillium malachiteum]
MFRTKSQKVKQKQKQKDRRPSVSSTVSQSSTKNSSVSTLPVQSPMDSKNAPPLISSSPVVPESKPEAPVLMESPVSDKPEQAPLAVPPEKEKLVAATPAPKPIAASPSKVASVPPPAPSPLPPASTSASASFPANPPTYEASDSKEPAANNLSPPVSIPTEPRPVGGRRNKSDDEANGTTRGGELVAGRTGGAGAISNAGLQIPGKLLNDPDEKAALKVKVHLNLHAKVRLDLDAQIYGDVVIGLL